ncbi:MAG: cation-transporting P-type ATPase, partial [Bryobacteraceae bacterium]
MRRGGSGTWTEGREEGQLAFWNLTVEELCERLQTSRSGLSSAEAQRRLRRHGPNVLRPESRWRPLWAFLRFFANPLVIVLLVASGSSIALGDRAGGAIIIAIVALSVI